MSYIASVGLGIPAYTLTQDEVKNLIPDLFPSFESKLGRILPIFDHSLIETRQTVVPKEWFIEDRTFVERNELYQQHTIELSVEAIHNCLTRSELLSKPFPVEQIDAFFFVSSSGISTPSIDAHIMNRLPFRNDVVRIPLWGLGCAGGAIALARANDWLRAFPTKNTLIISSELCSLTFQKKDQKMSNLVGTALFGDGVSATLLCGDQSSERSYIQTQVPRITHTHSHLEKDTLNIMGWKIVERGFEVIFSKKIPQLIESIWKPHVNQVLEEASIPREEITSWILHPGGRKVIEEMKRAYHIHNEQVHYSIDVLRQHGNMSSTTIFYILKKWLEQATDEKRSILSALGPGFSSEVVILKWEHIS